MIKKSILIVGAGPVGSLLAIYMAKRGYKVSVYDKRNDPRKTMEDDGRSINLALSHRGIHALRKAGLEKLLLETAIPMNGRMIHDLKGNVSFQVYGEEGQFINSISRGGLNRMLIDCAEKEYKISFYFNEKNTGVDFENNQLAFENVETNICTQVCYELLAAADGAFSQVRKSMSANSIFQTKIEKLAHGYKELTISAGENNTYLIEKNALHIWPRGEFMFIALPNTDGSFTGTLFLPFEGENSFESINSKEKFSKFFNHYFKDALPLIEQIEEAYFARDASSLGTLHTYPWVCKDAFLIGDASHAMVPFYGQGMNAGFEDVRILDELLTVHHENWETTLLEFQKSRKPNSDAISELAMQNFIEMRDLVDDEQFILRKKIEHRIHEQIKNYLPLYSMVTFTDIPYSEALQIGREHDELMAEILALPNIKSIWDKEEGWNEILKIIKG